MAVKALAYVRLEMREPEQWRKMGEEILGFRAVESDDGAVRLQMDGAPFRYIVEQGETDRFVCAGWSFEPAELVEIASRLDGATEGSAPECAARSVDRFISVVDPSGNRVELCSGRGEPQQPFEPCVPGLGYVADDLGLGHLVLPALEHEATSLFYREVLGFGMSDDLTLPSPAEGVPEMRIHFMHAENPRHHSLALFNGPAPSGVVHLMTELETLDQVGACLDRVQAAGLPVVTTLGRHFNDQMVSFYFLMPGGIPMEVGYDGLQLDWTTFTPTVTTQADIWGHEYNFPEA